ncbi:CPBP family intramembrane glutamic endopeptidase [Plantibacter sp. ME-Dv--P-122b]|uniref:CPBP family intramembrane glutamic endopeptidase n=1 Tax=Plantibacter sp. ME-Dv--P-122b TaxID=3040300 RepID=UPI00254D3C0B|nr:CPBP family intramembrane glutamic endopeptidase [Plantibacter sp. ME-Dv--P-122b]
MSSALKVRPRVWIGLAIYLGYIAVVFTVQLASGVRYDELGESGSNLFFGAGLSLIIAAVLLAITTTLLGWWRPAVFDRHRSVRWPIIAPILMVVALVFNLISTDWAAFDGAFLAAALVIILVGFTEEITTRGLLLTGLRSRLGEGWVWFVTSVLFAAMHLLNATGQALGATLQQVVFAFVAGTVFYILRRVTGTLVWAMVLHGLWDFSTFALSHGTPGPLVGIGAAVNLIAGVFGLIAVAFVIRGADERLAAGGGGRP